MFFFFFFFQAEDGIRDKLVTGVQTCALPISQWTRYLTVLLCLFQSYGYALFAEQLPGAVAHPGWAFRMTTVLTLSTGGVFIMWLGEQITERGIGDRKSTRLNSSH